MKIVRFLRQQSRKSKDKWYICHRQVVSNLKLNLQNHLKPTYAY